MFLELINDLLIHSTVFYIYFGMLLVTIGISQVFVMRSFTWHSHSPIYVKDPFDIKRYLDHCLEILTADQKVLHWFVKSFKRIDTVDDDEEDESNSYISHILNIRGGLKCQTIVYPQPFGKFSFSFFY